MKTISSVFLKTELKDIDDYIIVNEQVQSEGNLNELNQQEIRVLIQDFHTHHYWDKNSMDEENEEGEDKDMESGDQKPEKKETRQEFTISCSRKINQMFMESAPLDPEFCKNYEKWLEENVWEY